MSGSAARDALTEKLVVWFVAHGIGDTSLRTLAAGVGTSHRMLLYHFGSRAGLLSAVVERVEREERARLEELLAGPLDPWRAGLAFWLQVADVAQTFAGLYFELAGHAVQDQPHATSLRSWLSVGWSDALHGLFVDAGCDGPTATVLARQSLAMARGLLLDLALTGDRAGADTAMAAFVASIGGPSTENSAAPTAARPR